MRRLRSRGGFSLVECVITLAVIAIVSAAAISIIQSAITVAAKNTAQEDVRSRAENALEYFKWDAEGAEEYLQYSPDEAWKLADSSTEKEKKYVYQNVYYGLMITFKTDGNDEIIFSAEAHETAKNNKPLFVLQEYGGGAFEP